MLVVDEAGFLKKGRMSAGVQGRTLICTTSGRHHLLARRSLTPDSKGELELASFTCHPGPGSTLAELVSMAGARWARPSRSLVTITEHCPGSQQTLSEDEHFCARPDRAEEQFTPGSGRRYRFREYVRAQATAFRQADIEYSAGFVAGGQPLHHGWPGD